MTFSLAVLQQWLGWRVTDDQASEPLPGGLAVPDPVFWHVPLACEQECPPLDNSPD